MLRDCLLLALLVILSHVPFLWRPFHIDDRIYIEISRQAAVTPLYPQDYRAVFEGRHGPDAASHSHPPLISYLLALLRRLSGTESEVLFHTAFLVFPVLLGIAVYMLASTQNRFPLLTALTVVWNPGIYVLSQSVMTDVPFLALYALGISLFVYGERRRRDWRWPAAFSLAVAVMINYLALSAIPLLAASQWRRSRVSRLWPVIFLPLAVGAAWIALQSIHYGRFVLAATAQFLATEAGSHWFRLHEKGLSAMLNLGALVLVTSIFQFNRWRHGAIWISLILGVAGSAVVLTSWHWLHCLLLGVFLASAGFAAGAFGRRCWRESTDAVLNLWILGFLAACLLIYYHGSIRYVLPLVPPFAIVLGRWSGWSRARMTACVAATLGYGILLAHADYQFAAIYPRIAAQTLRDYPERRIWATGEWGFRYYMEREGAQTLVREDQRPDAGDILVKPWLAMPYVTGYDSNDHAALLRRESVFLHNPIRLLDFASHAGFYSTGWGILPWSVEVERKPVEMVNFFRIWKRFQGDASKRREDYFR
ncbi:MAG: hypothetical protein HY315_10425 [Acidobacteria bacterium]|nr:hypothetical protein [Acidobacteriota bacterium]